MVERERERGRGADPVLEAGGGGMVERERAPRGGEVVNVNMRADRESLSSRADRGIDRDNVVVGGGALGMRERDRERDRESVSGRGDRGDRERERERERLEREIASAGAERDRLRGDRERDRESMGGRGDRGDRERDGISGRPPVNIRSDTQREKEIHQMQSALRRDFRYAHNTPLVT